MHHSDVVYGKCAFCAAIKNGRGECCTISESDVYALKWKTMRVVGEVDVSACNKNKVSMKIDGLPFL